MRKGCTEPRLYTQPLRELTPETSLGFECIEFAKNVLHVDLLPWQEFWLIHALELREDGNFRFRTIITLVARQNGKTFLLKVLALFFMHTGRAQLVVGAAQNLDIAREAWLAAIDSAQDSFPDLIENVRYGNIQPELKFTDGCRYAIKAASRGAGRGLSVDLLILDELREHRDYAAWSALSKTTTARPNPLTIGISNAGDDQSVVLNNLRASALAGEDDTLGLFEWSAPDGSDLDDCDGWAQANPSLGYTLSEAALESAMSTDPPAVFRTESLCQKVDALDSAIDQQAWKHCSDPAGSLDSLRDRVVVAVDVAPDSEHVTLCAAALGTDGRVRVEVVAAWTSTEKARKEIPALLEKIQPIAVAWFPGGPAAALAADLRSVDTQLEIKGTAVQEACLGFADLVAARRIVHGDDPLLNAHIAGAQKFQSGDGWRFVRRGVGHVDAAYAAAGAVYLAVTTPAPVERAPLVVL